MAGEYLHDLANGVIADVDCSGSNGRSRPFGGGYEDTSDASFMQLLSNRPSRRAAVDLTRIASWRLSATVRFRW